MDMFLEQSPVYHPPVCKCETSFDFTEKERTVLRRLAERVAVYAKSSEAKEKRARWTALNDLRGDAPVIFADPEFGWNEIIPADTLECADPFARVWEMSLRKAVFEIEQIKDDRVFEPYFDVPYAYTDDGWGIEIKKTGSGGAEAFHIEAALEDYEEQFENLHFPAITIDESKSSAVMELAQSVFSGILTPRRHHNWHWAVDYLDQYVLLRGMEDFMCDFITQPEWIHKTLRLITDGMNKRLDWLEKNGLLTLNNDSSYIGTGGQGFTDALPAAGFEGRVRTSDMWAGVQAQETVSINPDMFGEFILPYEAELAKRFGLVSYGCCEPYDPRIQYIKKIPNLRRISCSPWSDFSKVPELIGRDYVSLVKLKPTPLAVHDMNEDVVRRDCRDAVQKTKGARCEFLMKDNHTLGNNPQNIVRWTQIMREEIEKVY